MIESINALENALAYAKFEDAAIKKAALEVLGQLDSELSLENYEQGTAVEEAQSILLDAINATDSQKEEKAAEVKAAAEDEGYDQFAGLGEEDEDEGK